MKTRYVFVGALAKHTNITTVIQPSVLPPAQSQTGSPRHIPSEETNPLRVFPVPKWFVFFPEVYDRLPSFLLTSDDLPGG